MYKVTKITSTTWLSSISSAELLCIPQVATELAEASPPLLHFCLCHARQCLRLYSAMCSPQISITISYIYCENHPCSQHVKHDDPRFPVTPPYLPQPGENGSGSLLRRVWFGWAITVWCRAPINSWIWSRRSSWRKVLQGSFHTLGVGNWFEISLRLVAEQLDESSQGTANSWWLRPGHFAQCTQWALKPHRQWTLGKCQINLQFWFRVLIRQWTTWRFGQAR